MLLISVLFLSQCQFVYISVCVHPPFVTVYKSLRASKCVGARVFVCVHVTMINESAGVPVG